MDTINGITSEDGWTEIVSIQESVPVLITDASMSANTDGTFRFTLDGNGIKYIYYRAKDYIPISRNLPYFIPANYKIAIEFLSEEESGVSSSSVSGCLGGIKNG